VISGWDGSGVACEFVLKNTDDDHAKNLAVIFHASVSGDDFHA
jgi:hypothetical protein